MDLSVAELVEHLVPLLKDRVRLHSHGKQIYIYEQPIWRAVSSSDILRLIRRDKWIPQPMIPLSILKQDQLMKQLIESIETIDRKSADQDWSLLAFKNGVFDFKRSCFRLGLPSDNLSFKIDYDYNHYTFAHPQVKLLREICASFFPDTVDLDHFYWLMRKVVRGTLDRPIVHFGDNDTGKTTMLNFVRQIMDNYAFNITHMTDIARYINGKRLLVCEDISSGMKITQDSVKYYSLNLSNYQMMFTSTDLSEYSSDQYFHIIHYRRRCIASEFWPDRYNLDQILNDLKAAAMWFFIHYQPFIWTPDKHAQPSLALAIEERKQIRTLMLLRYVSGCLLNIMPNELMFELFTFLVD